jgi:beta-galactosidase
MPGEAAEFTVSVPPNCNCLQNGIVYLHGDLCLKNPEPWAEAGFPVGSMEWIIKDDLPGLVVTQHASTPDTSKLENLKLFAASFIPSLFRVPTENDGLKTYQHLRGDPAAVFYYQGKAMYPWLDMDLLHLRLTNEKTKINIEGSFAENYTAHLAAGKNAAENFKNTRLGIYTRNIVAAENQLISMELVFDFDRELPELPKVGITAKIPMFYNRIQWFGAGPEESYSDRCSGVFLGKHETTPADMEVPYIVPQENGNRTGVRLIKLLGDPVLANGFAPEITIVPEAPINMSVSRYSQENMWEAFHTCDLIDLSTGDKGYYFLHLDCAQRGVGTAACGPDTLEQYRVRPGIYRMKLLIF